MEYQRHFDIIVEGIRCDVDLEFTYEVAQYGQHRTPIVTNVHKVISPSVRECWPGFWLILPPEVGITLDRELIEHHDRAVASHMVVERAI